MLANKKIESLLGGVSQQPAQLRHPTQAEAVENCLPHPTLGLLKRPPTKHAAVIDADAAPYANAEVFEINQGPGEKYFVAVANGKVSAIDSINNVPVTVLTPDARGLAYLSGSAGYRASTVGDYTFLVNRGVKVKRGTKKTPGIVYEALLFVRQADFSTAYSVTLDQTTVAVQTVDAANATSRALVATDNVAAALMNALLQNSFLSTQFTFLQLGSSIYLKRNDGKDFVLATTDGLADKGLKAIKGAVQSFDELPSRAKNGMVVEVTGAPESDKDNYWVQYDDSTTPGASGVWRECPKPGTLVNLDDSTMPWALVLRGDIRKNIKNIGHPPVPVVARGATITHTDGWTNFKPNDAAPSIPVLTTHDVHLSDNLAEATAPLTGVTGDSRTLRVNYDVDTTLMEHGRTVKVNLLANVGSGFTKIAEKAYDNGQMLQDEYFDQTLPLPVGTQIKIQTEYPTEVTQTPTQYRKALVVAHRQDHQTYAGIRNFTSQSNKVTYPATAIYPRGTVITVLVDGISFSYTITADDSTGTDVATAMVALIDPHASFTATAPSAGVLQVGRTDGTSPGLVATAVLDTATTYYSDSLTFVAGEHDGKTIRNLTDGSQGTITSTTKRTLVCSGGLSGGSENHFQPGDVCTIVGTGAYFVLQPLQWAEREAGDLTLCPFPSFVDKTLNDVFFYKNRLGFTSDENVVLSAAGDLFRFSRYSQAQLLDDDVIDVKGAFKERTPFRNALPWTLGLMLFSDVGPFILSGEPHLSPKTVRIDPVTTLQTDDVRPVAAGDTFFLARSDSGFTHIHEMRVSNSVLGVVSDATEATALTPRYLAGKPVSMAGDGPLGFLAVVTDADLSSVYVFSWKDEGNQRVMGAWHKWTLPGASIKRIAMTNGGVLGLFVNRSGTGMTFETIDVQNPMNVVSYVDRYGYAPTAFTMRYRLSPIYLRDDKDQPLLNGRLNLRYLTIYFVNTMTFDVSVTPPGRSTATRQYRKGVPTNGFLRVPVLGTGDDTVIEVVSASDPCTFAAAEWEGTFQSRSKQ